MLSPVISRGHLRVGDLEENHEVAPLSVRWLIIFVLASINFLDRFGLNLNFYAVDACLFAKYGRMSIDYWPGSGNAASNSPFCGWYGNRFSEHYHQCAANVIYVSSFADRDICTIYV